MNIIFISVLIFSLIYLISANNCTNNNCDNCPKIKIKRKWGGEESLTVDYQIIPVKYVIIHHTVTSKCSTFSDCSDIVKNIQNYHMKQLGWSDIGYNFLIGDDGNIYEGAGWHKIGAHTIGYNSKSIGIAFIGNFNDKLPSSEALTAGKKLLNCGVEKGELSIRFKLLGARQVLATVSPGLELYNEIQEWDNWTSKP